jgi:hypothetical protein
MLHPRDRYRKEPENACLQISVALAATVIFIFLGVWLILALTHVSSTSNDTKQMTSLQKTVTLTDVSSNNTLSPQISLKTAKVIFQKENLTFYPVVLETKASQTTHKLVPINLIEISRNSLARKGRYMRRALFKNKKNKYSNSD